MIGPRRPGFLFLVIFSVSSNCMLANGYTKPATAVGDTLLPQTTIPFSGAGSLVPTCGKANDYTNSRHWCH